MKVQSLKFKNEWYKKLDGTGNSIDSWCVKLDDNHVKCTFCLLSFSFKGLGLQALKNHALNKQHIQYLKDPGGMPTTSINCGSANSDKYASGLSTIERTMENVNKLAENKAETINLLSIMEQSRNKKELSVPLIQPTLDKLQKSRFVGLQYIIEIQPNECPSLLKCSYYCGMCNMLIASSFLLIPHIRAAPHKLKVAECIFPTVYEKYGPLRGKLSPKDLRDLNECAFKFSDVLGAENMTVSNQIWQKSCIDDLKATVKDIKNQRFYDTLRFTDDGYLEVKNEFSTPKSSLSSDEKENNQSKKIPFFLPGVVFCSYKSPKTTSSSSINYGGLSSTKIDKGSLLISKSSQENVINESNLSMPNKGSQFSLPNETKMKTTNENIKHSKARKLSLQSTVSKPSSRKRDEIKLSKHSLSNKISHLNEKETKSEEDGVKNSSQLSVSKLSRDQSDRIKFSKFEQNSRESHLCGNMKNNINEITNNDAIEMIPCRLTMSTSSPDKSDRIKLHKLDENKRELYPNKKKTKNEKDSVKSPSPQSSMSKSSINKIDEKDLIKNNDNNHISHINKDKGKIKTMNTGKEEARKLSNHLTASKSSNVNRDGIILSKLEENKRMTHLSVKKKKIKKLNDKKDKIIMKPHKLTASKSSDVKSDRIELSKFDGKNQVSKSKKKTKTVKSISNQLTLPTSSNGENNSSKPKQIKKVLLSKGGKVKEADKAKNLSNKLSISKSSIIKKSKVANKMQMKSPKLKDLSISAKNLVDLDLLTEELGLMIEEKKFSKCAIPENKDTHKIKDISDVPKSDAISDAISTMKSKPNVNINNFKPTPEVVDFKSDESSIGNKDTNYSKKEPILECKKSSLINAHKITKVPLLSLASKEDFDSNEFSGPVIRKKMKINITTPKKDAMTTNLYKSLSQSNDNQTGSSFKQNTDLSTNLESSVNSFPIDRNASISSVSNLEINFLQIKEFKIQNSNILAGKNNDFATRISDYNESFVVSSEFNNKSLGLEDKICSETSDINNISNKVINSNDSPKLDNKPQFRRLNLKRRNFLTIHENTTEDSKVQIMDVSPDEPNHGEYMTSKEVNTELFNLSSNKQMEVSKSPEKELHINTLAKDPSKIKYLPLKNGNFHLKDGNLPLKDSNLPLNDGNLPLNDVNFPLKNGNFPLRDGNLSLKDEDLPIKDDNFPLKDGNLPLKDGNLPLKDGNLPLKDDNLPVDDGKFILNNGNVPFNKPINEIKIHEIYLPFEECAPKEIPNQKNSFVNINFPSNGFVDKYNLTTEKGSFQNEKNLQLDKMKNDISIGKTALINNNYTPLFESIAKNDMPIEKSANLNKIKLPSDRCIDENSLSFEKSLHLCDIKLPLDEFSSTNDSFIEKDLTLDKNNMTSDECIVKKINFSPDTNKNYTSRPKSTLTRVYPPFKSPKVQKDLPKNILLLMDKLSKNKSVVGLSVFESGVQAPDLMGDTSKLSPLNYPSEPKILLTKNTFPIKTSGVQNNLPKNEFLPMTKTTVDLSEFEAEIQASDLTVVASMPSYVDIFSNTKNPLTNVLSPIESPEVQKELSKNKLLFTNELSKNELGVDLSVFDLKVQSPDLIPVSSKPSPNYSSKPKIPLAEVLAPNASQEVENDLSKNKLSKNKSEIDLSVFESEVQAPDVTAITSKAPSVDYSSKPKITLHKIISPMKISNVQKDLAKNKLPLVDLTGELKTEAPEFTLIKSKPSPVERGIFEKSNLLAESLRVKSIKMEIDLTKVELLKNVPNIQLNKSVIKIQLPKEIPGKHISSNITNNDFPFSVQNIQLPKDVPIIKDVCMKTSDLQIDSMMKPLSACKDTSLKESNLQSKLQLSPHIEKVFAEDEENDISITYSNLQHEKTLSHESNPNDNLTSKKLHPDNVDVSWKNPLFDTDYSLAAKQCEAKSKLFDLRSDPVKRCEEETLLLDAGNESMNEHAEGVSLLLREECEPIEKYEGKSLYDKNLDCIDENLHSKDEKCDSIEKSHDSIDEICDSIDESHDSMDESNDSINKDHNSTNESLSSNSKTANSINEGPKSINEKPDSIGKYDNSIKECQKKSPSLNKKYDPFDESDGETRDIYGFSDRGKTAVDQKDSQSSNFVGNLIPDPFANFLIEKQQLEQRLNTLLDKRECKSNEEINDIQPVANVKALGEDGPFVDFFKGKQQMEDKLNTILDKQEEKPIPTPRNLDSFNPFANLLMAKQQMEDKLNTLLQKRELEVLDIRNVRSPQNFNKLQSIQDKELSMSIISYLELVTKSSNYLGNLGVSVWELLREVKRNRADVHGILMNRDNLRVVYMIVSKLEDDFSNLNIHDADRQHISHSIIGCKKILEESHKLVSKDVIAEVEQSIRDSGKENPLQMQGSNVQDSQFERNFERKRGPKGSFSNYRQQEYNRIDPSHCDQLASSKKRKWEDSHLTNHAGYVDDLSLNSDKFNPSNYSSFQRTKKAKYDIDTKKFEDILDKIDENKSSMNLMNKPNYFSKLHTNPNCTIEEIEYIGEVKALPDLSRPPPGFPQISQIQENVSHFNKEIFSKQSSVLPNLQQQINTRHHQDCSDTSSKESFSNLKQKLQSPYRPENRDKPDKYTTVYFDYNETKDQYTNSEQNKNCICSGDNMEDSDQFQVSSPPVEDTSQSLNLSLIRSSTCDTPHSEQSLTPLLSSNLTPQPSQNVLYDGSYDVSHDLGMSPQYLNQSFSPPNENYQKNQFFHKQDDDRFQQTKSYLPPSENNLQWHQPDVKSSNINQPKNDLIRSNENIPHDPNFPLPPPNFLQQCSNFLQHSPLFPHKTTDPSQGDLLFSPPHSLNINQNTENFSHVQNLPKFNSNNIPQHNLNFSQDTKHFSEGRPNLPELNSNNILRGSLNLPHHSRNIFHQFQNLS